MDGETHLESNRKSVLECTGWVDVTGSFAPAPGQPFVATILVGVVVVAAVAFGEEAAYRGYPIKNLAEGVAKARWGMVIAVVIPAIYFGLAHRRMRTRRG